MTNVETDHAKDPLKGDIDSPNSEQSGSVGSLVLVATPIGNLGDISHRAVEVLAHADLICCEDTRHTGKLLKLLGVVPRRLLSLHEHNETERTAGIVDRIIQGELVALVSDAGTPVISDPGGRLVAHAAAAGCVVSTVPGPSAAIAALSISGLPAERFIFLGFLSRKGRRREEQIAVIAASEMTTVFYESPLRVHETLEELRRPCGDDRSIAIIRELTKLHEEVWRGTIAEALDRANAVRRGEFVVVVGPATAAPQGLKGDIAEKLDRLIAAGLSRRDAASALAILLEVPHRVAYESTLGTEPKAK